MCLLMPIVYYYLITLSVWVNISSTSNVDVCTFWQISCSTCGLLFLCVSTSKTLKSGCLKSEGGVHSMLAAEVVDKTLTSAGSSGGETSCTLPGLA